VRHTLNIKVILFVWTIFCITYVKNINKICNKVVYKRFRQKFHCLKKILKKDKISHLRLEHPLNCELFLLFLVNMLSRSSSLMHDLQRNLNLQSQINKIQKKNGFSHLVFFINLLHRHMYINIKYVVAFFRQWIVKFFFFFFFFLKG
jgi:hypothetical protein